MYSIDAEAFEALVHGAVASLPQQFRDHIENLSFAVEDRAAPEDLRLTGTRQGHTLLGVYRGVPLPRRGGNYSFAMPDVIVIFRQPLQQIASDADHLAELVEHTVRHEIAHYFGISDERLHELDAY